MNLTIPNLTQDQINSIQQQMQAGAGTPPGGGDPMKMLDGVKNAPSNWAAYTFCNSQEWAALDALYGVPAVNEIKNYYQGNYRMNGLVNPGDPGTALREINAPGPWRYYYYVDGQQTEDTGQADKAQEKITNKPQPKLPIHP